MMSTYRQVATVLDAMRMNAPAYKVGGIPRGRPWPARTRVAEGLETCLRAFQALGTAAVRRARESLRASAPRGAP